MWFTLVLDFIKRNWKFAVLLCALAFVWGTHVYINHLQHDIEKLQGENKILKDNVGKLESAIDTTNKAIALTSKSSSVVKSDFDKLNRTVLSQTADLKAHVDSVMKEKKPVDCSATIQYLIDARKDYQ